MNTQRRQKAQHLKDAEGRTVCSCGCGRHPSPPRTRWFSETCVTAWKEINDPSYIRQKLKKRDGGICALCGCDSEAEYRRYLKIHQEANALLNWLERREQRRIALTLPRDQSRDWHRIVHGIMWPETKGKPKSYAVISRLRSQEVERLAGIKNPGWTSGRTTAWDADHIVPVVEGGGLCGLDNYRTLCHPCHKKVTADLAARLARKRSKQLTFCLP
jgi:5-methylcytosine-specific restriction endonuclease McrA